MTVVNFNQIIEKLESHQTWVDSLGIQGEKLNLDEVDLRNVDLSKYTLNQSSITGCIFDGIDLQNKDISSAILCSSSFKFANLEGSDFCKSNVSYADYTNANIKCARLADCECVESVFAKANFSDANLVAALFDETDFREATLNNADVRLATFEGVMLKGARLAGLRGLNEAFIKSINIGTIEDPIMLRDEEARQWLLDQATGEQD
ncbi:pentapeptide repeat-containing protein [Paenibacillus athensensis]|uniref:Pentapeptide repeat-containing protein n=1 Tax=Paenibacillus athensensis TaxID=1967502 RepID=A0A4Y8PUW5_9BACL|nr:pentapeptide repeat-containing protein [Paenibacillus athensensis]MCD1261603.1 pentapeptide repeat-containing protein [Paenibacillus athensensis]